MMKKLISLSVVFLLFFLITPQFAAAGNGNPGQCVIGCNYVCAEDIAIDFSLDCTELTGEDRKDCQTLFNLLVRCCVVECMEEDPGCLNSAVEAPEGSLICEHLEDVCEFLD